MDALMERQHTLFGRISRAVENLKKLGKANMTKGTIQTKLAILESTWAEFQSQDLQIDITATAEERQADYFTEDLFEQTEGMFCIQKGELLKLLDDLEQEMGPPASPSADNAPPPACGRRSRSSMPRIDLPTFSGRFDQWTRFRDLFTALVIKDDDWTDAERFHYLSASLSGEAAQLINRIPITGSNFVKAWELLGHRYQNRRLLIAAQFDLLFNATPCIAHTAGELKTILNNTCNVAANLNSLDVTVDDASHWVVHQTVQKLDKETVKEWEKSLGNRVEPPPLSELLEFLETTIRGLEAYEVRQDAHGPIPQSTTPPKVRTLHTATSTPSRVRCNLCQGSHILCFCSAFKSMTQAARLHLVSTRRWCTNCLGPHDPTACPSPKRCQRCAEMHHSMLHDAITGPPDPTPAASLHILEGGCQPTGSSSVLLATALVSVTAGGRTTTVRALVDPCSEVSLATESLAQRLRLPRTPCSRLVVGAGANATATTRGKVVMTLSPTTANRSRPCKVEALVLPRLTTYRPCCPRPTHDWPHVEDLQLADPGTTATTPIELLLGADVYPQILRDGTRRGGRNAPIAQETMFGWILTGPTARQQSSPQTVSAHTCTTDDLTALVRRFWEQEELQPLAPHWTEEEAACEHEYKQTHSRQTDGRYVVRLCLKRPSPDLGESHNIARRILLSTERRLQTNPSLHDAYHAFMLEYQQLGHMLAVPRAAECTSRPHFYLPHHGVLKGTGASAKLRVVFNGSRSSSSGRSLNQYLAAGPKLQRDLMDILLRWRRHKVAFTTDIEKMYRQIQVHPDDRDYQRILWRDDPTARIQVFHLATVTYGLSCAPFLAIRTLLQLADDEEERHPRGASILREATYVDDILSGADTVEEARRTQADLIDICKAGGFTLKKWNANDHGLLSHLPADFLASSSAIPWYPEIGCSALGLTWHPQEDTLSVSWYGPHASPTPTSITKRYILSQIAKLFDPLGWLAPFLVRGKILLQNLWKLGLGWDDRLPDTAVEAWTTMTTDAATLSTLRIPRWLGVDRASSSLQLHVFVDASEKAYAAATYLRASSPQGTQVTLVAAKTKTAPLKNVSLPRLELCATVLGARLLQRVKREIQMTIDTTHLWSDSTIALAWLHGEPMHWRTYVANRVAEFQRTMPDAHLHHVRTADNPADCASRGIPASHLANHPLWWTGPKWLRDAPSTWDTPASTLTTTEEERPPATCLHSVRPEAGYEELLLRYSQVHKLIRVTAWCLRWRRPRTAPTPALHPEELDRAEVCWIKLVQDHEFRSDLTALRRGKSPSSTSSLRTMAPFIDDHGILRVGGRIRNSLLSYDEQHPIILPPGSGLTHLIIDQHHYRTLHGGVQLTLASTRQRFWIPQGRQQVKKRISRCLTCLRWRAASVKQVMGDLPLHRVTPSRPFLHTGLDYAGPFRLKTTPGRGHKTIKGYVSIFVCFSSKAVHIEAVSDYSTPAFLAAFRRFTGRRGLCTSLTSDCGTNFVGADKELRRMFKASSKESAALAYQLSCEGVQWRFNPPGAPHFGGLWEAAVRSVKHHLRRVIGDNPLTYEEFATFLCQVEACLNSRPLQPLTDDPEDLTPLTPGHFLIGGPLLAVPEPSQHDVPSARLTRWQQQQQRLEHFWRRWSAEYLHQLQSRPKWTDPQPSLAVGDLVLVKAETTPPTQWPLARVIDIHPGPDGNVRVVTVKTAASTFVRPVTKIVCLFRESGATP